MRTYSPSIQTDSSNDGQGQDHLDELLNALVVMRWDLDTAIQAAAQTPRAVTDRLEQLRNELDLSIAVLKKVSEEQELPPQASCEA